MNASRAKKTPLCILGAQGYIGARLTRLASARGFFVKALARGSAPAGFRNGRSVRMLRGGAADQRLLERMIEPGDTVINLVGATTAEARFEKLFESNVAAHYPALEACVRRRARKIIFASSITVYGSSSRAAREDDLPRPQDEHALTKWFAEQLYEFYGAARGIPVVILRLGSVYGPDQRKGIIYSFAQSLKNSGEVRIPERPVWRDFVFIDDVLEAIMRSARFAAGGITRFNIASGRKTSLARLARMVRQCVGRPVPVRARAPFPALGAVWASRKRAERALGWKPRVSLASGLRKTFRSYGVF